MFQLVYSIAFGSSFLNLGLHRLTSFPPEGVCKDQIKFNIYILYTAIVLCVVKTHLDC